MRSQTVWQKCKSELVEEILGFVWNGCESFTVQKYCHTLRKLIEFANEKHVFKLPFESAKVAEYLISVKRVGALKSL